MEKIILPNLPPQKPSVSKNNLINELKTFLISFDFKKIKLNRFERATTDFVEIVLIEGSRWEKEGYDIRVGIKIRECVTNDFISDNYGDFSGMVSSINTTKNTIFENISSFFHLWTNKEHLQKYTLEREIALKELDSYVGDERKKKKIEFYEKYNVNINSQAVVDCVLAPTFIAK